MGSRARCLKGLIRSGCFVLVVWSELNEKSSLGNKKFEEKYLRRVV